MPMIAMTTNSSTRVKPLRRYGHESLWMRDIGRILIGTKQLLNSIFRIRFPLSCATTFRRRQPDLHGTIQTGRGNPLAVGAEGHAQDPARVAAQDVGFRAGPIPIPHLDGAVG